MGSEVIITDLYKGEGTIKRQIERYIMVERSLSAGVTNRQL